MVTDLKHVLGSNPLMPTYVAAEPSGEAAPLRYQAFDEGLREIGQNIDSLVDFIDGYESRTSLTDEQRSEQLLNWLSELPRETS